MPVVFRTQRRIEFFDTDMAGIVHFSRFFIYMEQAETEFLRSMGLSVSLVWEGQAIGFPRVSAKCDYISTVTFEDVMDIEVSIEKLGTKSITYQFNFSKDGRPVAVGTTVACCCQKSADRKMEGIPIPESFKAKLEALMTSA
jgi:acyl-CoA thioester hydrolase